jgi:hypothetical protein
MPIDFTNIEQVKTAIMQHISSPAADRWRLGHGIPDVSDSVSIAHRIEFQEGSLWRHAKLAAVEHCLFELVRENRIAYLRYQQVNGVWRDWYGPHPTTDEERRAWERVRATIALRAKRTDEDEPAAKEGEE